MPVDNQFQHQDYLGGPPRAPWQLLSAWESAPSLTEERCQMLARIHPTLQQARVRRIYLMHGTFAGDDPLGALQLLSRILPGLADRVRQLHKETVDRLAQDWGNYTPAFAGELAKRCQVPVGLLTWSSENTHLARADAAIRLIETLASETWEPGERVLLWGHSHAGNVFALLTNLLAADSASRARFFRACRTFYINAWNRVDLAVWERVRLWLESKLRARPWPQLDLVTFGTPIRYGWDSGGYAKLLHVVHHRPRPGLPAYQTAPPRSVEDVLQAADGDYIQQLGIAGTNLTPHLLAWRSWLAEGRLGRLLQKTPGRLELLGRWQAGVRVPAEGQTLLVDYGPTTGSVRQHLAGHAVYTRGTWLPFHAAEIVQRLYGESAGA